MSDLTVYYFGCIDERCRQHDTAWFGWLLSRGPLVNRVSKVSVSVWVASATGVASLVVSSHASAADDSDATSHEHDVDVVARGALGPTGIDGAGSVAWRLSTRIAVGALFGVTRPAESHNSVWQPGFNEEHTTLFRGTALVRWDFHAARYTRAWIAADVGALFAVEYGRGPDPAVRSTRSSWGICASGELGLAMHPVELFSIGPSLIVMGAPFQSYPFTWAEQYLLGMNVALHIPIGDRRRVR